MEHMKTGRYALLSIVFILFFAHCKEELANNVRHQVLENDKSLLQTLTPAEQYAYLTHHLDVLRNGILSQVEDGAFRSLLYREVEKRFDGDYNVLLNVLAERSPSLFETFAASRYTEPGAFSVSLEAFTNIPDSTTMISLYPQIYIPEYEQLKAKGLLNSNPTLVSYSGDEELTRWSGVRINAMGEPEEVTVDEEYVRSHEVWVVSLSESYHGGAIVYLPKEAEPESDATRASICLVAGYCQSSNTAWNHGKLRNFKLKCDLDNILSGANDLSDHSYSTFSSRINPFNGSRHDPQWIGDPDHRLLKKANPTYCYSAFNKMFFEDWRTAGSNPPNNQGMRGNLVFYVFFEYDNWPARLKPQSVSIAEYGLKGDGSWGMITTKLDIMYRSSQKALASGVMDSSPVCDGKVCGNTRHPCVHRIETSCFEAQFSTE
ncbi:hypothetical protein [Ohtaekwangia koreensis]|uniref:Uncharacterized protein n=1 Tax=Ohtaekwangia koreensis TaxID=688867 RepID=A0A1T5LNN9_9BACT|nr:hypothetical protein [Ohtaekwangia koreensis]SKC77617.1 hypothetical protein SAMN05660236_3612 [Ohtaekwangia koreensis]